MINPTTVNTIGPLTIVFSKPPATELYKKAKTTKRSTCIEILYLNSEFISGEFARQAQNSWLLQSAAGRRSILAALDAHDYGGPLEFRLYVDGDFGSVADVRFWMQSLQRRQWCRAFAGAFQFDSQPLIR